MTKLKKLGVGFLALISSLFAVGYCSVPKRNPLTGPAPTHDPVVEIITGMVAGLITSLLFYPFECVEARLQISTKKEQTLFQMMSNILSKEGVAGLYVGIVPTLLGGMINWGIYFFIYQSVNNWWLTNYGISGVFAQLTSGAVAGAVCAVIVNPFWVLKIRVINAKQGTSTLKALDQILATDGFIGLYKGLGPSLLGTAEGATQFASYEQLKLALSSPDGTLTLVNQLLCGAISRVIATLITYPYVLLRSVLQMQNSPYTSLSDACTKIYNKEGFKGLYRGMPANLIRQVPPAAFMFLIVEKIRGVLLALRHPHQM